MIRFAIMSSLAMLLTMGSAAAAEEVGAVSAEPSSTQEDAEPSTTREDAEPSTTQGDAATTSSSEDGGAQPEEVVLFMRRDTADPAFLHDALRADGDGAQPGAPKSPGVRYSLSDNLTAGVSYSHAFLFENASDEELRQSRVGSFSTARERDVFGLGMDWGVSDKSRVGIGYQLQSVRPDGTSRETHQTSILPGSEGLDHSFTLGVTRSWGGSGGK